VAGAFDHGAYLLLPGNRVVALLTAAAARLPNAVVVAPTTDSWHDHEAAWVGEHRVRLPSLEVRVVRWWVPRQVRRAATLAAADAAADALVRALARHGAWPAPCAVRQAAMRLGRAAATGDLPEVQAAGTGLVGLGPGLTPAGDDVLTGFLLGAHALDEATDAAAPLARACAAGVRAMLAQTTALAATLVRHAAADEAADVAANLVDALVEGTAPDRPLRSLLLTGDTSGRDLAEGMVLALRATLSLARRDG
jgi:hypothetical protein